MNKLIDIYLNGCAKSPAKPPIAPDAIEVNKVDPLDSIGLVES